MGRSIDTEDDLFGGAGGFARPAPQPIEPAGNRTAERVGGDDPLRRVAERLQQHGGHVLAIDDHRAAAPARQPDARARLDLGKDAVGPPARPLDIGDEPLPALVGMQIAHRAAALIRAPLLEFVPEATANVAFVVGEGK